MMQSSGLTWPVILAFANLVLSSAIVITAFSLLGFMLTRNLRSTVAQTFSILLTCVLIVFAIDIIVPRVESAHAESVWMRLQWIGIALVPAAYLHFSDAVLRTTGHWSLRRRAVVIVSYLFSAVLVLTALFTNLLVRTAVFTSPVAHLAAGPLFPLFVAYFIATGLYGGWNVYRARRRCLTPTSRRRMTYLTVSFAAPGLGVFPYLLTLGAAGSPPVPLILFLSLVANFAVGTMLVVMAYAVTYLGVLSPERVIKHDLLHYLLRGPVVGIIVIVVMLVIPRVELILGLPRDTALIFAVVGVMVLGQLAVNLAKPWIDRLLYPEDREEIVWIQTLDRRLLTSGEVSQFLTNILISLCDLMRVPNGFVMVQTGDGLRIEAVAGDHHMPEAYLSSPTALEMWQHFARSGAASNGGAGNGTEDAQGENTREAKFHADTGFWFCPLRSQDGARLLGLLAVVARTPDVQMDEDERAEAEALLTQAAAAVADRYVQEGVFATLQSILPDLERIQEWRSAVRYAAPLPPAELVTTEPAEDTQQMLAQTTWQQWVKDALSHYWGGPKLTESPLMDLRLVRRRLKAVDGNLTAALRAVLQEAIERQRPPGDRKLNASEWLVYNILDLRFVQGQRVLDISRRLSMSESDLYRKQRVAVAAVARTLAEMEASLDGEAD
jgi:hypothetical protein